MISENSGSNAYAKCGLLVEMEFDGISMGSTVAYKEIKGVLSHGLSFFGGSTLWGINARRAALKVGRRPDERLLFVLLLEIGRRRAYSLQPIPIYLLCSL